MQIIDHRLDTARQAASPNHDDRPHGEISLIVLHGISLPKGRFGGPEIEALFCNQLDTDKRGFRSLAGLKVSSHLLIRRDGEIVQFVDFDKRAWHAGESAWQARGNCNDFSIGIELEGMDTHPYNRRQYDALSEVCQALMQTYGIMDITAHSEIAPGRKTDPGPAFSWSILRSALATAL